MFQLLFQGYTVSLQSKNTCETLVQTSAFDELNTDTFKKNLEQAIILERKEMSITEPRVEHLEVIQSWIIHKI